MKQALAIAFVAAFSSSVIAQKPVKEPPDPTPGEFAAGEVCAFPVRLAPGGNTNVISFPSGRLMYVGSGSVTATNLTTGFSIELPQSGRYSEKLLGDGTVKIETNGQQLIFLLPQDVGGPGLPLVNGHAVLTYDIGTDTVTPCGCQASRSTSAPRSRRKHDASPAEVFPLAGSAELSSWTFWISAREFSPLKPQARSMNCESDLEHELALNSPGLGSRA